MSGSPCSSPSMIVLTPCQMENPAPSPKVAREARNAQKYVSRPYPKGCLASGARVPRLRATNRKTSVTVSATECAASDIIAEEWLISPPISLATAMARFASPATMTVPVDSPPPSSPCPWRASSTSRASLARACSVVGAGCVMRHRCPGGARVMRREQDVAPSGPRRGPGRRDGGPRRLSRGTPPGRDAVRRTAVLSHAEEVDDEDQGRPRLDDAARAALAVGLVRGDGQPAPAPDLHAGDA